MHYSEYCRAPEEAKKFCKYKFEATKAAKDVVLIRIQIRAFLIKKIFFITFLLIFLSVYFFKLYLKGATRN
jgi:hypothetical protein